MTFLNNVLQKLNLDSISELLLLLILITIPLGFALNSISIILFSFYGIVLFFKKKNKIQINILEALFIIFFLWGLLSLFWTSNIENTFNGIIDFLPYLAIPIGYIFQKQYINKTISILRLFSISVFVFSLYCIFLGSLNSYVSLDFSYLFYHKLSQNLSGLNAIYLSVLVSFSIGFFLTYKKSTFDLITLFTLSLFLVLLSSKLIIFLTLLFSSIYLIKKTIKKGFKKKYFYLIILGLVILTISSKNIRKRIQIEVDKTKIAEILEKNEFGQIYLWTGTGLRVFQAKVFLEILEEQENYFLGFGLDNSQKNLIDKYKQYNLYPGFYEYNYHNQYIQTASELGFVGLIIILSIFFVLLKIGINRKDFFLLYFAMLIVGVCVTETFLWRQRGMVFFILTALLLYRKKKHYIY
ncbi:MAG: O-antigen ligase family protein [Flavobacteriaceae bacterium]